MSIAASGRAREGKRPRLGKWVIAALLICGAASMLVPFFWMLITSVKPESEVFTIPMQWLPSRWMFSNYAAVWTRVDFLQYYLNTIKITVITTVGQLTLSSLAAYSFSKLRYPGRDKIFLGYLATLMVPWYAIMVPQFIVIQQMELYNTHTALILMSLFSPFGVFLLRQFFIGLPNELLESARIDGSSELRIWATIVIPLSKPAIATLLVFSFMGTWNDFMGPLIYLTDPVKFTIQLGVRMFRSQYRNEVAISMAATVCSLVPIFIIYIFAQRYLIEGIQFSGIKG